MVFQRMRVASAMVVVTLSLGALPQSASARSVNDAFARGELFIWNRFADFLEMARGGVAVGPAIGGEIALTDKVRVGAYRVDESGATFPHFIPPLWAVPWLEGEPVFRKHGGSYWRWSFFQWDKESSEQHDVRFPRDPKDLRAQLALGLVHGYMNVQTREVGDFFAGIVGFDPMGDDEELDPNTTREPARHLGRGLSNLATGIFEVPKNMHRVNRDRGGFAALTVGLAQGIWRFGTREAVGLMETVTFPMGWKPILEPEFPFQPTKSTEWRINEPDFRRNF
ncbi:MAG: exosortase system-associated protein, TIGR04073 family [Lentisphaerae bacterium]|jgi:putative exosortase-associated protein (TIGR04073 family)|nr:exosortase system-associated protein, TIGR04073 family [Lentisphaerota bacterium]MBT4818004.1 exosortase system-associated protein, TIGR04073 family [Lentisphaerota bacterium]MBT5607251.1 exosortase system-associated protein, TIGR04073 family [Lentisphaerota bacterium]MBT7058820.1 exosortase system-associated protein, TIGR04073 family [Lentisphaerota bacterium]MBT7842370.1 exosortase system-associated protein, TIGR04073 family [Lentisphaerota bacterium]